MADYVPPEDAEFHNWAGNFVDQSEANGLRYGYGPWGEIHSAIIP